MHTMSAETQQVDDHPEPKKNTTKELTGVQIMSAALRHGAPRFLQNTHLVPLD